MFKYSFFNLIKRKAKTYSEAQGISLSRAQEYIARVAGFANYHEMVVIAKNNCSDPRLMAYAVGLTSFEDILYQDPHWEDFCFLVDDALNAAITDTNASSYSIENLVVSNYDYDCSVGVVTLVVDFEFQGEQHEDRPWAGNAFYIDAEVRLIFREKWSLLEDDALTIINTVSDRDLDFEQQRSDERE
jgi:hypothetical protein